MDSIQLERNLIASKEAFKASRERLNLSKENLLRFEKLVKADPQERTKITQSVESISEASESDVVAELPVMRPSKAKRVLSRQNTNVGSRLKEEVHREDDEETDSFPVAPINTVPLRRPSTVQEAIKPKETSGNATDILNETPSMKMPRRFSAFGDNSATSGASIRQSMTNNSGSNAMGASPMMNKRRQSITPDISQRRQSIMGITRGGRRSSRMFSEDAFKQDEPGLDEEFVTIFLSTRGVTKEDIDGAFDLLSRDGLKINAVDVQHFAAKYFKVLPDKAKKLIDEWTESITKDNLSQLLLNKTMVKTPWDDAFEVKITQD